MRDYGARDAATSDLLLLSACVGIALLAYALPRNWADGLVGGVRRTALRPVVALQSRAEQDRTSRFRLEAIRASRDSLALRVQADSAIRQENAELRRMLALRERRPVGWIAAQVLHRPVPTDARMLTLDVGTAQGVTRLQPVLTPDGLLGVIANVSPASASAITWMHPDWRASAVTADGAVMGILAPTAAGPGGQPLLELRGVPLRDSLATGTIVYTSGLGGVYPQMIPVGRVVGVGDDPMGYERLYRVAPFANPGRAGQVMVLTSPIDSLLIALPEDSLP